MPIVEQAPLVVCDICEKKEVMTTNSYMYQFWKISLKQMYCSGKTRQYHNDEWGIQKDYILCTDCKNKLINLK